MSSVRELYVRPEKGVRQAVDAIQVNADGVAGDRAYGRNERQISICDAAVFSTLSGQAGLCTGKFVPNITTDGLLYAKLRLGMRLAVGSTVCTVTRVGKECFAACERFSARDECPLACSCAFLAAACAGGIQTGDRIEILA